MKTNFYYAPLFLFLAIGIIGTMRIFSPNDKAASTLQIANAEALADGETGSCYYQTIYDPYGQAYEVCSRNGCGLPCNCN